MRWGTSRQTHEATTSAGEARAVASQVPSIGAVIGGFQCAHWLWATLEEHTRKERSHRGEERYCEGLHHVPEAVIRQGRASPPTTRKVVGSLVLSAMRQTRSRRYTQPTGNRGASF